MKRNFKFLLPIVLLLLIVGCSKKVTQKDLMANPWGVKMGETEEQAFIADFTKTNMSLAIDTDAIDATSENSAEEMGAELAKDLFSGLSFKINYTLNDNTIHLKNKELELDDDFKIKKENDTITLTNKNSDKSMILTPLDENKK